MLERLSIEEQIIADLLLNPIAFSEIMFDHFALQGGTFTKFNPDKFSTIRLYQFAFFSFDSMLQDDPKLSKKENFRLKINAGTLYNMSGRGIGKTVCEKLNIIHSIFLGSNCEMGLESYDSRHVNAVFEPVAQCYEYHPLLKYRKKHIRRGQELLIETVDDLRFYGLNADISGGLSAGDCFFGKHLTKLFIEEFSKENNIIYNKRQESETEYGAIINASGMCDFLKHSPAGKIFYEAHNKKFIINLPKFILADWDEKSKEDAIRRYGSPDSVSYKVYVLGQPIKEGTSAFDEQRIRLCQYSKDEIKHFEINKENYENYILVTAPIIRPKNSESIWISIDVGTSSETKALIFSKQGEIFYYLYKITLRNIINPQLEPFFDFLIEKLKAEVIAVDCGDGDGRNLAWHLESKFGQERVFEYKGAENLRVRIARDEFGNPLYDKDNNLIFEYEKMHRLGAEKLRDLFYEGRLLFPVDYELDEQITSVIAVPKATGIVYEIAGENDHLWNALKAFACAVWDREDFVVNNQLEEVRGDDFWGFV